jgi:hypothetical protein
LEGEPLLERELAGAGRPNPGTEWVDEPVSIIAIGEVRLFEQRIHRPRADRRLTSVRVEKVDTGRGAIFAAPKTATALAGPQRGDPIARRFERKSVVTTELPIDVSKVTGDGLRGH